VEKPAQSIWTKAQEHSSTQGMPLRSAALEERGWTTRWEVVTFVECGECNYKGTETQENKGQGFVTGEQLNNICYQNCLEAWKVYHILLKWAVVRAFIQTMYI